MTLWLWAGFLALVALFLALDLGVLNRGDRIIGARAALLWTAVWIGLSLLFGVLVYVMYEQHWLGIGVLTGHEAALELPDSSPVLAALLRGDADVSYQVPGRDAALQYLTGYVLEKSLSLDNIFVIALVFRHFKVPLEYQHRVLFWGILGALVMRGAMIGAGVVLIQRFSFTIYVFGGFLIFTALRMLVSHDLAPDPEKSRLLRWTRKLYPVSAGFEGHAFFTRVDGRRAITPLFLVLLVVESSDVLFAVDSIPAIFAVTHDPFLVFTSNIFAILGLRSLYFALAQLLHKFHYLQSALVLILAYVGVKMILSHHYPLPGWVSLTVIGGVVAVATVASVIRARWK
jgi:tellurite resistance protein TerC